jgi:hypothetical protein
MLWPRNDYAQVLHQHIPPQARDFGCLFTERKVLLEEQPRYETEYLEGAENDGKGSENDNDDVDEEKDSQEIPRNL